MNTQNFKTEIKYQRLCKHIFYIATDTIYSVTEEWECGALRSFCPCLKLSKTSLKKHFCLTIHKFLWAIKAMLNKLDSSKRLVFLFFSLPLTHSQRWHWKFPEYLGSQSLCTLRGSPLPPKQRAAIMPQCFQWNVSPIVDRDDSHWEDSPPPSPTHPFAANTIQCVAFYLWRHATVFVAYDPVTASRGQDNEKDDAEVIS